MTRHTWGALIWIEPFSSSTAALRTILALKGWYVAWEAATVDRGGGLRVVVGRGDGAGHEGGLPLGREQPQFLAADVEASGADEGPPQSARAGAGRHRTGHRGSGRRDRGGRPAAGFEWEVVWRSENKRTRNGETLCLALQVDAALLKWEDEVEHLKVGSLCRVSPACCRWTGSQILKDRLFQQIKAVF